MSRWYLAGPMSNVPQFNIPAFEAAAIDLRNMGYEILSPAEKDREHNPAAYEAARASPDGKHTPEALGGESWGDFLARDVKLIADLVDGVVMLPNWQRSRGARLEVFVALLSDKQLATYDPILHRLRYMSNDYFREILQENMP